MHAELADRRADLAGGDLLAAAERRAVGDGAYPMGREGEGGFQHLAEAADAGELGLEGGDAAGVVRQAAIL